MDIKNVAQRQDTFGTTRQTKGSQTQQGDTQFAGTLGQVDGQTAGDGNSEERAASSVKAEPELIDQQKLREERLQRFGSFTAYSLWRKTPAMALGIVQPKSEEYFAEHGLLEYWRNEKAHWQGKVAIMSEEQRAATGTSLLDEPVGVETFTQQAPVRQADASEAAVEPPREADVDSEAIRLAAEAPSSAAEPIKSVTAEPVTPPDPEPPATPVAQSATTLVTTASAAVVADPVASVLSGGDKTPVQVAVNTTESNAVEQKVSSSAAAQAVEEPAPSAPPVPASQPVQEPKTQAELRAERLERFGSYTAYSLWRKIPAMALGIVQPKSEEYIAEHGLLEYWYNERNHWQGKVAAMTEEERAATGTSLLETTVVDQTESSSQTKVTAQIGGEAVTGSQPASPENPSQAGGEAVTDQTSTFETEVASQGLSTGTTDKSAAERLSGLPVTGDEPVAPELTELAGGNGAPNEVESVMAQVNTNPVVQEIEQAKTQEELRQERLERFGSYTAYSLWRKIPAMALGIVQPKSEEYFAEHGLLEYWHTEKNHWQSQVASMSLAERAATGTSLLDEV